MMLKKILNNWLLDKPSYHTLEGWADWRDSNKQKYPVRYFLQEDLPSWYTVHVGWKLRDMCWSLKHRFIRKHQYHIIRPSTLSVNYHDPRCQVLHSVMHILVDFMENGAETIDWGGSSPEHQEAYNELKDAYNWWLFDWPHREERSVSGFSLPKYPDRPEGFSMLSSKDKDTPEYIERMRIGKKLMEAESEWEVKEVEMLTIVIKNNHFMWS